MATIRGTDGDDLLKQNSRVEVSIYGYDGDDDIYLNRTDRYGGNNFVDAGDDNDLVVNYFEGGNDVLLGNGNDLYIAEIKAGASGEYDVVRGGYGNDRFEVDTYASDYYGDAGNDTFFSVGYDNYFNGGSGTDTISYQLQDDYSSQRGKGVTVDLGLKKATTGSGHREDLISIENATGTNSGHDDITGSSAANVLKGLGGNDILEGLGGNDDLYGGSGHDDLYGGSGNDILVGNSGSDYLHGGTGTDTFDFNSVKDSVTGSNRDVIADFHRSEADVIDLRTIDANELRSGNQAFTFIGGAAFSGKAGELRLSSSSGILGGDTDGDGRSDFHIDMNGITKMYADDFFL
ncbi:calcium-binding protein [Rhizobium sp. Root482]|uniref:calcium-binding protein n=1 Tax=Rhizobium sp. Root482 TaxID=1736543 RepID=UPI0006F80AAB|nr:M10 family metallopeptidase C-terminal domain-containing protein [Rhizobium sp. Root482]KQY19851.1 hemolysin [Rhizobium sp. Root482]